jgi:hypothetical protein
MNTNPNHSRYRLLIAAAIVCTAAATAALHAASADRQPASASGDLRITGNLIDTYGDVRRSSQPFILTIDHFSSDADLQAMNGRLTTNGYELGNDAGAYGVRDNLWHRVQDGTLRVGGGIGYPVSLATSQETPNGRTLRMYLNRPLGAFEVQNYTRSSRYPFTYIEINLDKNGKGQGALIAAARLSPASAAPQVTSLGSQPIRLLDVIAR